MIYYFVAFVLILFVINQVTQFSSVYNTFKMHESALFGILKKRYLALSYFKDHINAGVEMAEAINELNYNQEAQKINAMALEVFEYLNTLNEDFLPAPIMEAIEDIKAVEKQYIDNKKKYINAFDFFNKRNRLPHIFLLKKIFPFINKEIINLYSGGQNE